ncbi:heat shock factor-type transcription factor [Phycomyces blakesleeanus]|uniref:Heat shock factor-type transcription factor n=2 Tax=Phycomyces blakesleeanus TaxID=4837 RepID=A0A163E938_PHYB8|nr:heat shock factor-type transcription factor [Phycomyces blakesleeanus NRRL 1555(-)]OAD77420.1 heat shock factor-type transcription factor [Phycomyces blakesleeanus NRRL 1555(-)]|eukprot:XP_018295460.1 heat shock factor-type transcription factor [Phycomyces blakesleeanus NRRL 1555(-)]
MIPHRLTAQRSVPAFLNKLYNMVEDTTTKDLIRWATDGASFIVERHEEFAKAVLPRFYKHNTFASFVRQLNMYDFHKVPHIQQGVLIADNENEIWEFSNPHFQRERPDLLALVTRKRSRERDTVETDSINIATLVKDISAIRKHQTTISSDIHTLHSDNEVLWKETLSAREKQQQHQDAIEKILQFLTTIFSNDNKAAIGMSKQKPFMLKKNNECLSLPCQSTSNIGILSKGTRQGYAGMPDFRPAKKKETQKKIKEEEE